MEKPPQDMGIRNLAVMRSVGNIIKWNERYWRWDGKAWQCAGNPCPECGARIISLMSGVKCSKCDWWYCA
jgi:hypothetical protein